MILFAEDWLKYPHAIPDYQTSNQSFLKFAGTLHKLGVKNCLFHLALHDNGLQGVDPFDPDLTKEQMERICIEALENPWYFVRELLKLPAVGQDGIKIIMNRGFAAQWWVRRNNIDVFCMQPRQTGKSVCADSQHVYNTLIGQYRSQMFALTKDRSLIVKNVARLKAMRDMLPKYLWYPSKKDKDVEDVFNYAMNDNVLVFRCGQNDKEGAIKAARGFTTDLLHIDEGPFIKYIENMIPTISASMDAAIRNAKDVGSHYGRLFTTTAGDLSLPHGRYMYNMYSDGFTFTEDLYDLKNRDELWEVLCRTTGKKNPMVSMTFNYPMLGYSEEELYRNIETANGTEDEINKDYFLIWGKGGSDSIVDSMVLKDINSNTKQPEYNELTEVGYVIKWYIPHDEIASYMENNTLILGADTSEQIKRDGSAFVMINVMDLSTVATININDANIITSAKWLAGFMKKYRNVVLMIEKKSSAQSFIDSCLLSFITHGINPFKRIWNRLFEDPVKYSNEISRINRGLDLKYYISEYRNLFGFNQTSNTRHLLYSQVLPDACSRSRYVVNDDGLATQISRLKINSKTGKIDHESSGHDDYVIAWLLAHWMLRFGKNLDYYGIDSKMVMFNVGCDGKKLTDEDIIQNDIIKQITEECEETINKLKMDIHPGLRMQYEARLKRLNTELEKYGYEPKTIDAISKQHSEDVKQKRRQQRHRPRLPFY